MTPSHTLRTESLTDDDRRRAATLVGLTFWTNLGCLALFLAPLLVLGGWAAAAVVAGFDAAADPALGWLVAGGLVVLLFVRNSAPFRRDRAAVRQAVAAGRTDVLEVTGARWVLVARRRARGENCFAADIGDGKILLLSGLWLEGPDTYGASRDAVRAARKSPAPGAGLASRLPRPHAFPCADFTLRALLATQHALSLRPAAGSEVPAVLQAVELSDRSALRPCLVLDGSLEDVDGALDRGAASAV